MNHTALGSQRDPRIPRDPRDFSVLVAGQLVSPSQREVITRESPAYGIAVSRYPRSTPEDVAQAIDSARATADSGVWASIAGSERARLINRVAQLIDRNREELALIESLEVGKPLTAAAREMQGTIALWELRPVWRGMHTATCMTR